MVRPISKTVSKILLIKFLRLSAREPSKEMEGWSLSKNDESVTQKNNNQDKGGAAEEFQRFARMACMKMQVMETVF